MGDTAEFLLAQYDVDAEKARNAVLYSSLRERDLAENWGVVRVGDEKQCLQIQTKYGALRPKPVATFSDPAFDRPVADHIARHGPAAVLADIESKRAIVAEHEGVHSCGASDYDDGDPCPTLRLLAKPFASRAGYNPAWTV